MDILEACNYAANDPETIFDISLISLTVVSYSPYYVNFWFDNGPDMSSVLACFLGQFGCYTIIQFGMDFVSMDTRNVKIISVGRSCKGFRTHGYDFL